jgi:hypothetical protein
MDEFTQYYNHEHHHTGIGLHTPADVHYALTGPVDKRRHDTLATARAANPERFTTATDPKILTLPETAWINPPIREPAPQPANLNHSRLTRPGLNPLEKFRPPQGGSGGPTSISRAAPHHELYLHRAPFLRSGRTRTLTMVEVLSVSALEPSGRSSR